MVFRGDSGVEDIDERGFSIVGKPYSVEIRREEERMLFATGPDEGLRIYRAS